MRLTTCLIKVCFVLSLPIFAYSAYGQSESPSLVDFTRILGPEDIDVVVPQSSIQIGTTDASALQAILDFLTATAATQWTGMQAAGSLTSPGDSGEPDVTLSVRGGNAYRMDVNAQAGQRSIRIDGVQGQSLGSDGIKHRLPLVTSRIGLIAFPRLFASGFPTPATSVVDQGLITVGGAMLHRITVTEPLFPDQKTTPADQLSTIDLYFDPISHLLIKSVASIQLEPRDRERYLEVITYGDYRVANGLLLPFAYIQTLNGQRQWALQLTNIQLGAPFDSTYFTF